jgi:hypothetical protein
VSGSIRLFAKLNRTSHILKKKTIDSVSTTGFSLKL